MHAFMCDLVLTFLLHTLKKTIFVLKAIFSQKYYAAIPKTVTISSYSKTGTIISE